MQYKIPVQIENADPIFLWLSLKQLIIIMVWWGIWYSIFKWLTPSVWAEVALFSGIFILVITLFIALFKTSEMTFLPYILNLIRQSINSSPKIWVKWIDSISAMEIWYVIKQEEKKEAEFDMEAKEEKIKSLEEKISHI